jgi:hypothetical protein
MGGDEAALAALTRRQVAFSTADDTIMIIDEGYTPTAD